MFLSCGYWPEEFLILLKLLNHVAMHERDELGKLLVGQDFETLSLRATSVREWRKSFKQSR